MIKENLTPFLFGDNNQDETDSAVEKFMNYVPGNWEDWKNYCDELHERCLGAFEANKQQLFWAFDARFKMVDAIFINMPKLTSPSSGDPTCASSSCNQPYGTEMQRMDNDYSSSLFSSSSGSSQPTPYSSNMAQKALSDLPANWNIPSSPFVQKEEKVLLLGSIEGKGKEKEREKGATDEKYFSLFDSENSSFFNRGAS